MCGERSDQIKIQNLEVFGKHGVFPEENRLGQKFLINAVLYLPLREAGLGDELEKTADYGEIAHFMTSFMVERTFRLIEAAAEQMAEAVLLQFPMIRKITLEIQKPWAPIGLPLESVSAEITRGWHQAYLSVGSNLGDRERYIEMGIEALRRTRGCVVEQASGLLETKPYGLEEQPDFLNGAVALRTLLSPRELLEQIHRIEREAGRERLVHWGPRTLDLDLIFYDDLILDQEDLQIPHPDMQNRRFVLEPLAQIAPWLRHPLLQKTVRQMLGEL